MILIQNVDTKLKPYHALQFKILGSVYQLDKLIIANLISALQTPATFIDFVLMISNGNISTPNVSDI